MQPSEAEPGPQVCLDDPRWSLAHSQMSASIVVFDHPFFVAPDATGAFVLRDVPPGRYTIVGWHERIGERSQPIDVASGESVNVTLSLPVEEPR